MNRATLLPVAALAFCACANESRLAAEGRLTSRDASASAPAQHGESGNGNADSVVTRRVWGGTAFVDVTGAPSPDGRYLSHVDWFGTMALMTRDLTTGESRRRTAIEPGGTTIPEYSIFSPDGAQVAYGWISPEGMELRIVALDGSSPRSLRGSDEGARQYYRPLAWSPDGRWIATLVIGEDRTSRIALVSATDSTMRTLKSFDWRSPLTASYSPDGRYLAYDFPPEEDSPARDVYVLAVDGSRERTVVRHPAHDILLGWLPDGRLLIASDRSGTTGAWSLNMKDGRERGAPRLVKRDLWRVVPLGITRQGSFFYGVFVSVADVHTARIDPLTGRALSPPAAFSTGSPGFNQGVDWSRDGEQVATLTRLGSGPADDRMTVLVIRSLRTGQVRQLRPKLNYINLAIRWAPDGRSIVATGTDGKGRQGIFRVDLRTGDVSPIVQGSVRYPAMSGDGRTMYYVARPADRTPSREIIVARDVTSGVEREIDATPEGGTIGPFAVSTDGRWMAFGADPRTTTSEVLYVMSTAGGERRELVRVKAPERIVSAAWAPDGRHVIFAKLTGVTRAGVTRLTSVWRVAVEDGQVQSLGIEMQHIAQLRVHPNGKEIAFTAGEWMAEVWVMDMPPADSSPNGRRAAR